MTYSQVLGVIGYSVLPLVITGPLVSVLRQLPLLAFLVKVRHSLHKVKFFLRPALRKMGRKIELGA